MRNRIVICFLLLGISSLVFGATPCTNQFVQEMSGPSLEHYNEQNSSCAQSAYCNYESQLSYNQALNTAIHNLEVCCKTSNELGC